MEFEVCAQCGKEIKDKGIVFRQRRFCSDECCEEFTAAYLEHDDPELADLAADDDDGFGDGELDFEDEDFADEDDDFLDDEFSADEDDF